MAVEGCFVGERAGTKETRLRKCPMPLWCLAAHLRVVAELGKKEKY